MKAIHAEPKDVQKLFSEKYIIPEYQHPYSWITDHCERLLDDIITFYYEKENKDDKYYMGNIVVYPDNGSYYVIDGQQRITTLLLVIKALYKRAGTFGILEECIKIKDPMTAGLTNELRVQSLVIEEDKNQLYDIIFNDGAKTPDDSRLKVNYEYIEKKIDEWRMTEEQDSDSMR
jgi:hypothetical protein